MSGLARNPSARVLLFVCALGLLTAFVWTTTVAGASLNGVACPSTLQCTAVDGGGHQATFNPAGPDALTPITVDAGHGSLGVACPSATQCTAVGVSGRQVTFNPTSPVTPVSRTIDTGNSPGTDLKGVACPTTGQCTAVDSVGRQVTFNPAGPGAQIFASITDIALNGVACPSASQCTTVDGLGREATFQPLISGGPALNTVSPGIYLSAVACPTVSQCTAVGESSFGAPTTQVTFVPATGALLSSTKINAKSAAVTAIACPAATQCSAVDSSGIESTFNPMTGRVTSAAAIDGGIRNGQGLDAVACPTTKQCTAVGASGRPVTFNPSFPNTIQVAQIRGNADGSVTVAVLVPPSGTVTAVATHVSPNAGVAALKPGKRRILYARSSVRAGQGRVTLHLRPSARGRRLLAMRHHLKLRITIAYRPARGFKAERTETITVHARR